MEKILLNLANYLLIEFCKKNNIDCSDTYVEKLPKKFVYYLCKTKTHKNVLFIEFHKNQAPSYYK